MRLFMRSSRLLLSAAIILVAVLVSSVWPAQAATFAPPCGDAAQLAADIATANTNGQDDTVNLAAGCTYNISAQLDVTEATALNINGNGATISGGEAVRVFDIAAGATLNLSNITVTAGFAEDGGGGARNQGVLTINNSTFVNNASLNLGGGGVRNEGGTTSITDSLFRGNRTDGVGAGFISNGGSVNIIRSTFTENISDNWGGAGAALGNTQLTIRSSTIANNAANGSGGGAFDLYGDSVTTIINSTISTNTAPANPTASGIYLSGNASTVNITNSIMSHVGGNNCLVASTGGVVDGGYNLENGSSCGFTDNALNDTNANLGALQNNGGYGPTRLPNPNSPVIDTGSCVAGVDQRGLQRPVGAACDRGAVEVQNVNIAPVANSDSYSTPFETQLVVQAPGVLGNDTDANNDALTAVVAQGPGNGALTLQANGGFTYTPNPGFSGTDAFTYRANDGAASSNLVAVLIAVAASSDEEPVANDDAYSVSFNIPLIVDTSNGVLANDTDPNGDPLTAILVSAPVNGTLSLNADGSFTYTPNQNYSGSDTFVYQASDTPGTQAEAPLPAAVLDADDPPPNIARVVISIAPEPNQAPVVGNDLYGTAYETSLSVGVANGVLANDSDPNGDDLSAELLDNVQNGTLSLSADGSFGYTPNEGFSGSDTFTYRATDGSLFSNAVTVTINVAERGNLTPVGAADSYTTSYETTLFVSSPGVLSNDTDEDGDTLSAVQVTSTANGSLNLNSDGSFTYTPNAGFIGMDTFSYRASDGAASSSSTTVRITVGDPNNDPPIATGDTYSTPFETILTVVPDVSVLLNDTDPNGDPITAQLVSNPASGSVEFQADGSFTYTPNTGFSGLDVFTYQATDGVLKSNTAIVRINVRQRDEPPIPTPDNLTIQGALDLPPIILTYSWIHLNPDPAVAEVPGDWYRLMLKLEDETVFDRWYNADQICESQLCEVQPNTELFETGDYTWTVTAFTDGEGPIISDESDFRVEVVAPSVPASLRVDASIGRPVLTWDDERTAAWFQVEIYEGAFTSNVEDAEQPSPIHRKWYQKTADICDGITCRLLPDIHTLNGNYSLRMRAWGPGGYNEEDPTLWSDSRTYSMSLSAASRPVALTITDFTDGNPNYQWQRAENATWYNLWITDLSGNPVRNNWYEGALLGCEDGICELTPDNIFLPSGQYRTYVSAWGPGGSGAWGQFNQVISINVTQTPKVQPLTPTNNQNLRTSNPTFTWEATENATWYLLYVTRSSPPIEQEHFEWHRELDLGCDDDGICELRVPDLVLDAGSHDWYVLAYTPAGVGPYSDKSSFRVDP